MFRISLALPAAKHTHQAASASAAGTLAGCTAPSPVGQQGTAPQPKLLRPLRMKWQAWHNIMHIQVGTGCCNEMPSLENIMHKQVGIGFCNDMKWQA